MLLFACDWCQQLKNEGDVWILGLAAENLGIAAARREVTILRAWDPATAVNPFAVHFCTDEHKNNYMAALFERKAFPDETVVETTAEVTAPVVRRKKILRTLAPVEVKTRVTKKRPAGAASRRRRRA